MWMAFPRALTLPEWRHGPTFAWRSSDLKRALAFLKEQEVLLAVQLKGSHVDGLPEGVDAARMAAWADFCLALFRSQASAGVSEGTGGPAGRAIERQPCGWPSRGR